MKYLLLALLLSGCASSFDSDDYCVLRGEVKSRVRCIAWQIGGLRQVKR